MEHRTRIYSENRQKIEKTKAKKSNSIHIAIIIITIDDCPLTNRIMAALHIPGKLLSKQWKYKFFDYGLAKECKENAVRIENFIKFKQ